MKVLTKELNNDLDLHEIQVAVNSIAKRTMPVFFLDGSHEGVVESDIKTVRTKLNVTDKENELKFMILPASFTFFTDYDDFAAGQGIRTPEEDFLSLYTNRLRIISYLPEDILKHVKDKRLLAMGYAEEKVKKAIVKYAKRKAKAALKVYDKSINDTIYAAEGLTIEEQFGQQHHKYVFSIVELLDEASIIGVSKKESDLYIELDNDDTIILTDAEILEEEIVPNNTPIRHFELHKNEQCYELHFLLVTKDNNLMENFHYVTYKFQDMRFLNP